MNEVKHAVWFNVQGTWVLRVVYVENGHLHVGGCVAS